MGTTRLWSASDVLLPGSPASPVPFGRYWALPGPSPRRWKSKRRLQLAGQPSFQPKKTKVLVKGKPCGKFFGECEVSTRTVEFSIKLFDCGHFYMKQTLPGSGASPYWVIFEGTWQTTEKGLAFEYLFRYSWQVAKTRLMPEFALEAVPKNHRSRLAWCGEIPEQQLNGSVPAIVGEDPFCWIEICREPDVVERGKARFNEEDDDIARRRPAPSSPTAAGAGHSAKPSASVAEDQEPMWPIYAVLGIFCLILFLAVERAATCFIRSCSSAVRPGWRRPRRCDDGEKVSDVRGGVASKNGPKRSDEIPALPAMAGG
eukprot:s354_g15.t1